MNSPRSEEIESRSRFYDERWKGFEFANRSQLLRAIAILDGVAQTRLPSPKILDLGCGAGWLSSILGNFGPTLGVDLSQTAISLASRRFPYVEFKCVNILEWDAPANQFDIVVSQEVLEHFEEQDIYLQIARSVLRSNGFLILTTPNARTFAALPENQSASWSQQPIENWVTARELARLLKAAGFVDVHISSVILGPGNRGLYRLVNSERLRRAARLVQLDRFLGRQGLRSKFGLHLTALARRP